VCCSSSSVRINTLKFVPYPLTVGLTSALIIFHHRSRFPRPRDQRSPLTLSGMECVDRSSVLDRSPIAFSWPVSILLIAGFQRFAPRIPERLLLSPGDDGRASRTYSGGDNRYAFRLCPKHAPDSHPEVSWQTITEMFSLATTIACLGDRIAPFCLGC
jgi:hypothetical protein